MMGGRRVVKSLFLTILTVILMTVSVLPCLAAGRNSRVVRVGWYEAAGYQECDADGTRSGYGYDYLQALLQYEDWTYVYVPGTWEECIQRLESGEIDLMTYMQKTEKRARTLDFSAYPMGKSAGQLICSVDRRDLSYGDPAAWDGLEVGMTSGSETNGAFLDQCALWGITVRPVYYTDYGDMIRELRGGRIPLAISNNTQAVFGVKILSDFSSTEQFLAVKKGNTALLEEIDQAMGSLSSYYPTLVDVLFDRYFHSEAYAIPAFTAEERQYIASHPTVRVACDAAWHPIEYRDPVTGEIAGITADLFARIGQISGIDFELSAWDSLDALQDAFSVETGELITVFSHDYNWSEMWNARASQPFLDVSVVCISKNSAKSQRVALVTGSYLAQDFAKSRTDTQVFQYYDTLETCLDAVRLGLADCTYANSYEAEYFLSRPKFQSLNFNVLPDQQQSLCLAIPRGSDPMLMFILSKVLYSIPAAELTELVQGHISTSYHVSLLDLIYTDPWLFVLSALLFLSAVFAAVFLFYRSQIARRANAELIQATAAKSEFLAHMSHDMRTPMNGVIGLSRLAAESQSLDEIHDYLDRISESSQYLLSLINDTLDMSKIESGSFELHLEPCLFSELEGIVFSVLMPNAQARGVRLELRTHDSHDRQYVLMDKLRVQQVMVNLVNNALKFSAPGDTVVLDTAAWARGVNFIDIQMRISDTGCGMSPEFQKRLFLPFEQENPSREGTGLGLSIVKSLVDAMGGVITCESELGKGSAFTVLMRVKTVDPPVTAPAPQTPPETGPIPEILSGRRILLAEDHPTNILVATRLLSREGMAVDVAENGKIAVEKFQAAPPGTYDAILMDVRMPVMDGYEATRTIRSGSHPDAARIPIIAMTANAFSQDVADCLDAGMSAHLAKPIDPAQLYRTLAAHIHDSRG